MWNGSSWIPLEYDAFSCGAIGSASGKGHALTADSATKATKDGDNNTISTTYLKANQVQTYASNNGDNNKVVKFNGGKIQFPNGAQFWVN